MYLAPTVDRPTMLVDEFGGYYAPPGIQFTEPMATLTRTKLLKRNLKQ